jgi:hypothetical protein
MHSESLGDWFEAHIVDGRAKILAYHFIPCWDDETPHDDFYDQD